tara:strand:- start:151 stop:687 length:537 start_codon:yes stop_codon:yes gene_type:complete
MTKNISFKIIYLIGSIIVFNLSSKTVNAHPQTQGNRPQAIRLRWLSEPGCNNPPACDLTAIVAGVGEENAEKELASIRVGDSSPLITRAQWKPLIDRYKDGRYSTIQTRKWYCGFLSISSVGASYYDLELVGQPILAKPLAVDNPRDCFCMHRTRYNKRILPPPTKRPIPNILHVPSN